MSSSVVCKRESTSTNGAPMIDLDALDATPPQHDPFDFLVIPSFLRPAALAMAIADYPDITGPGNHKLEVLDHTPPLAA